MDTAAGRVVLYTYANMVYLLDESSGQLVAVGEEPMSMYVRTFPRQIAHVGGSWFLGGNGLMLRKGFSEWEKLPQISSVKVQGATDGFFFMDFLNRIFFGFPLSILPLSRSIAKERW